MYVMWGDRLSLQGGVTYVVAPASRWVGFRVWLAKKILPHPNASWGALTIHLGASSQNTERG